MSIELRTSKEVQAGNVAITVSEHDAPIVRDFLQEAKEKGILTSVTINHLQQVTARAARIDTGQGESRDDGAGEHDCTSASESASESKGEKKAIMTREEGGNVDAEKTATDR
jgi:hypothetical protein